MTRLKAVKRERGLEERKRDRERDHQMKFETNRWKIVKGIQRCRI